MQAHQLFSGIFFIKTKYVDNMLARFTMKDYKPITTLTVVSCKLMKEDSYPLVDIILYMSLTSILMYLINTRHDIMFAVNLVALFMHSPYESYWKVVKIILSYVNDIKTFGLWYKDIDSNDLTTYTNANWIGILDDQKSKCGSAFFGESLI